MSTGADALALAALLARSRRTLVFTGAGVSTDSGIPDYRGPQGVWNTRRPVEYQDFLEDESERERYWRTKLEDFDAQRSLEPNPVHLALVRWERAGRLEALVTQNVDGLHARAGHGAERLVEVHGTNHEAACTRCGRRRPGASAYEEFRASGVPPRCACGGLDKPATISFGQSLREEDLERASRAASRADLVLALGTTLSVVPAANLPLRATERGVPYAIVNRGPTAHDRHPAVRLRVEGSLREVVVPAIDRALEEAGSQGPPSAGASIR